MAFAWIFHSNFESGSNAEWDSESDSDGVLDFPHYSELARFPDSTATPYSGAYCMRIVPAGGSADSTLAEADINIANATESWFHFNLWFGPDFDATANDTFALLELLGSGPAVTVSVGARYVAATDVINLGVGAANTGAVPTAFAAQNIARNQWYTVEVKVVIQTGGSGTVDLYVTRAGAEAQVVANTSVSSITNIVVTDGKFGLQDHETTTTGTILLDNFIQDDARIFPTARYEKHPVFTKSGHAFIGPGHIDSAGLLTDEASNVMRLWDTDEANTDATQSFEAEFDIGANFTSIDGPIKFEKGCYVELSGTDPRGQVFLTRSSDKPGVLGPLYHSDAGVRRFGLRG